MDVQFQLNNNGIISQREIEYDPLLEQEMSPALELDNFFSDELPQHTDESVGYETSLSDSDVLVTPARRSQDEGYVDLTDYSAVDDASPSELDIHAQMQRSVFRLAVIERTLGELQKYIGELLVLVREELGDARQKTEPIGEEQPPLPEYGEYESNEIVQAQECSVPYGDILEEELVIPKQVVLQGEPESTIHTGIFNGKTMEISDGTQFPVPENYASKSRLVHGDVLKLTISPEGKMIYKQIGPVARRCINGILEQDPATESYTVVCHQGRFRVLNASVSYYKGVPGDAVILLVPVGGPYRWGAVQSIVKNAEL
ncbi:MAG: hypothetical protein Q8P56_00910 [Candidatus Uhrbacteria bacterium]|nr:hypothetical protein [Candidatus Uhrbacteria bacterium]